MSSLEQQAAERKARLAQLRSLKRKADGQPAAAVSETPSPAAASTPASDEALPPPQLSGRNYDPQTREARTGMGYEILDGEETIELVAEEEKEKALAKLHERETAALNLDSLQPKKVNWDLKRDLEPKLALLETRTDNAIIRIVRERLKGLRDGS